MRNNVEPVERVPILFKRVPVITDTEPYKWEEAYEKFIGYIKYASNHVKYKYLLHGVLDTDDLVQEGCTVLWICFEKYSNKYKEEFNLLFKSSLWRHLRKVAEEESQISHQVIDLESVGDIGYTPSTIEQIEFEHKLQQVLELLGNNAAALKIFHEYLNPSERVLEEARKDIARKEFLKSLGHSISVPQEIYVKAMYIKRAWNMERAEYDKGVKLFKTSVLQVFNNDHLCA